MKRPGSAWSDERLRAWIATERNVYGKLKEMADNGVSPKAYALAEEKLAYADALEKAYLND